LDTGLPSAAGLAIRRDNIVIETKLHDLVAVATLRHNDCSYVICYACKLMLETGIYTV
jgi:hypothetical protein